MKNIFKIQFFLFVMLLLLWNIFTPVLEGADESGHFCHAEYIADRGKLPNLNNSDGCFLVYQPFYYLILVPVIKAFNFPEGSYRQQMVVNPRFELLRSGEYAQFVHGKDELFLRWDSFDFMVHLLRVFSSIYALAIFLVAWRVSKYVFKNPINRNLSMLLFFNPMFLHIFTTLTNVVLVTLLASLFIALEITYTARFKPFKITFLQGIIFGLGILTKISILGLGFAYVYLFLRRWVEFKETFSLKVKEALIFAIGALIVSGWYIYRSFKLYGEPLEVNVARPYAGEHHWTLLSQVGFLNFWNSFADTLFRTFWSGYGALTVNFPQVLNVLILPVTLLIAYAIITSRKNLNTYLKISVLYFLSALIVLIIVNIRTSSMHAKDIFIAYIPLAFLFSFGLSEFIKIVKVKKIGFLAPIAILAISFYFWARPEIVSFIKLLYQTIGLSGFYQKEVVDISSTILVLFAKFAALILIYQFVLILFRKITITYRNIYYVSIALFIFNLAVIAVSVYLFYYKFI